MSMSEEETEYPYMVIYNRNGEIGWSSDEDIIGEFSTYEEAKEYFDKIEVSKHSYDWSINWKYLYKVEVLERG